MSTYRVALSKNHVDQTFSRGRLRFNAFFINQIKKVHRESETNSMRVDFQLLNFLALRAQLDSFHCCPIMTATLSTQQVNFEQINPSKIALLIKANRPIKILGLWSLSLFKTHVTTQAGPDDRDRPPTFQWRGKEKVKSSHDYEFHIGGE